MEAKTMEDIGEDMASNIIENIEVGQGTEPEAVADGSGVRFSKEWIAKLMELAWDIDPTYTRDAMDTIQEGWMATLKSNGKAAAREFYGLIRIAKGYARMRLSETVDVVDAERALEIWRKSLKTYATTDEGYIDLHIKQSGYTESQDELRRTIKSTVKSLADDDRGAHVQDILAHIDEENTRITMHLKSLRESGVLYRPDGDEYYRLSDE
jgi:replicative DNA helicase Mcm